MQRAPVLPPNHLHSTAACPEHLLGVPAHLPPPPTHPACLRSLCSLQDCTARMFKYTASACRGGAASQAFQLALERGVTADSGERCLPASLPGPLPAAQLNRRSLFEHAAECGRDTHLCPLTHPPALPPAAYRYRASHPGNDASATGQLQQCDRAFLTGQPAKAGVVRITAAPAFTQAATGSKLALIQVRRRRGGACSTSVQCGAVLGACRRPGGPSLPCHLQPVQTARCPPAVPPLPRRRPWLPSPPSST